MQLAIGTTNKRKITSVQKIFQEILPESISEIISSNARSEVPETPWESEIKMGAQNRARAISRQFPNSDYAIGIESGLIERYHDTYEEVWCCLITREKKEYFSYSSGLKVPDFILNKMKNQNKKHWEIMDMLDKLEGRGDNDDTWGTYSAKLIIRDISFQEAIRNALIQVHAPKESYYHKK